MSINITREMFNAWAVLVRRSMVRSGLVTLVMAQGFHGWYGDSTVLCRLPYPIRLVVNGTRTGPAWVVMVGGSDGMVMVRGWRDDGV